MRELVLKHKLQDDTWVLYYPFIHHYIVSDTEAIENNLDLVLNNDQYQKKLQIAKINIPLSFYCSLDCEYCCEDNSSKNNYEINEEFALLCINEFAIRTKKQRFETAQLSFDYGGEPMCQKDKFLKISEHFRQCCYRNGLKSIIQVTTNGYYDSITCNELIKTADDIIVSLDGNEKLHNRNRITKDGKGSFDTVFENTRKIYSMGKLKYITTVVDDYMIDNALEMLSFYHENFGDATIRLNPLRIKGAAKNKKFDKINLDIWSKFIEACISYVRGTSLKLIDTHIKKDLWSINFLGCSCLEHPDWYCRPDNTVSSCYEIDNTNYIFAKYEEERLSVDESVFHEIYKNNVEKLDMCNGCIAKYYCAGGCPLHRNQNKINCMKRRELFVNQLLKMKPLYFDGKKPDELSR